METEEATADIDVERPVPKAIWESSEFGAIATALVVVKSIPLLASGEGVRVGVCEVVRSDMGEDVLSGVCEVVRSEDVRGRLCKDVRKVESGVAGFVCMKLLVLISGTGLTGVEEGVEDGVGVGCGDGDGGGGCADLFCWAAVQTLAPLSFC